RGSEHGLAVVELPVVPGPFKAAVARGEELVVGGILGDEPAFFVGEVDHLEGRGCHLPYAVVDAMCDVVDVTERSRDLELVLGTERLALLASTGGACSPSGLTRTAAGVGASSTASRRTRTSRATARRGHWSVIVATTPDHQQTHPETDL